MNHALMPSLGLTVLVLAAVSTSAPARADGPSPSYSPQYAEQVKGRCTVQGKTSALCVEFYLDTVVGPNKLGVDRRIEDDLRSCFADAKRDAESGAGSSSGHYAEKLLRAREAGDPAASHKVVEECLRVTAEVLGEEWRTSAMMAAFKDKVARALRDDFEKKCGAGARAAVDKNAEVLTVVAYAKSTSKTVAFQGTDPSGGSVSVLCSGEVVGKTKDGKAFRRTPRMADDVRNAQNRACLASCRSSPSNAACVEGYRRGKTTPYCESVCKDRCR